MSPCSDRSQRKIAVTSKGREAISYAERALGTHDEILHNITPRQMLSGIVRVGVAELVAMTWLPAFVATGNALPPHLAGGWTFPSQRRCAVLAGDLDVVLLPGEIADPALVVHPLGLVTFRWMAGAGMDLPDHVLSAQDLTRLRRSCPSAGSVHYSTILSLLGSGGSAPAPRSVQQHDGDRHAHDRQYRHQRAAARLLRRRHRRRPAARAADDV